MSNIALLERPVARAPHLRAVPAFSPLSPAGPLTPATPASAVSSVRPVRAVAPVAPDRSAPRPAASDSAATRAPRGFALYVGLDERRAAEAGVSLPQLVDALRQTLAALAPAAETHATVALAPRSAGGRDLDVVRLALQEPSAVSQRRASEGSDSPGESGVAVDISRKRVFIDGEPLALTFKEFELLQYLVLREGRTIARAELVEALWQAPGADKPGARTIDVHVRRLRAKLGRYEDIVRTARGVGYRFDRHADVSIRYGHGGPSPDRF